MKSIVSHTTDLDTITGCQYKVNMLIVINILEYLVNFV